MRHVLLHVNRPHVIGCDAAPIDLVASDVNGRVDVDVARDAPRVTQA